MSTSNEGGARNKDQLKNQHVVGRPSTSLAPTEDELRAHRTTRSNSGESDLLGKDIIYNSKKTIAASIENFKELIGASPSKSALSKKSLHVASENDISREKQVKDLVVVVRKLSDTGRAQSVPLQPTAPITKDTQVSANRRQVRFTSDSEYVDAPEQVTEPDEENVQVRAVHILEKLIKKRKRDQAAARATAKRVAESIPGAAQARLERAAIIIQSSIRARAAQKKRREEEVKLEVTRTLAAIKIQSIVRGFITRATLAAKVTRETAAAVTVQRITRGFIARKQARQLRAAVVRQEKEREAATNLQRIVRGFIARRQVRNARATLAAHAAAEAVNQNIEDESMSDTEDEDRMAEGGKPRYTGRCRDEFDDFLKKAEYWMINKKAVTDRQKIAQLSTMLTGGAEEWFNKQTIGYYTPAVYAADGATITTPAFWGPGLQGYDGVMTAMRAAFPKQERLSRSIAAAFNCKQGKRSVEVYLEEMEKEARKANLGEQVTISLAIAGLKPLIQAKVKDRADDNSTMGDIKRWAIKAEEDYEEMGLGATDLAEALREFKADIREEISKIHVNSLAHTVASQPKPKAGTIFGGSTAADAAEGTTWRDDRGGGGGLYRGRGYGGRGNRGGGFARGAYTQRTQQEPQNGRVEYSDYSAPYDALGQPNNFPPHPAMTFKPQQAMPAGYEQAAARGGAERPPRACWTCGAMDHLSANCMQRIQQWAISGRGREASRGNWRGNNNIGRSNYQQRGGAEYTGGTGGDTSFQQGQP